MANEFYDREIHSAQAVLSALADGRIAQATESLRVMKDELYSAIPTRQRQSRGITWVVERMSDLLAQARGMDQAFYAAALNLYAHLDRSDLLVGAPIFMLAEYGRSHDTQVLSFFAGAADASNWIVREFAAGAFRKVIAANKTSVLPWLQQLATDDRPNLRRFASETLRPVTLNRWLNQQPNYSLSVLRFMFAEAHPYPRTSVGNNLSDLSRRQPELIFSLVGELVASGDTNSYWIAYRACRNLVKMQPQRVMTALAVKEYHYKDRNFYM